MPVLEEITPQQFNNNPVIIMSSFDSSDDEEADGEVDLSPFDISWLDVSLAGCQRSVGISALPGCRFQRIWRSLEHDIVCLREQQVTDVYTLCTRGELVKYRVTSLMEDLIAADINVHHFPFLDGDVPNMPQLVKILDDIKSRLTDGKKALIHCFGGLGRSCVIAVCLMMVLDESLLSIDAINRARLLRGARAIQTVKQYNFVNDFRENLSEFVKHQGSRSLTPSR